MTPDEFRVAGHDLIEWIADYLERVEDLPVLSQVEPGEVRAQLPPAPPEQGEAFEAILADLDRVIVPGLTHWQSPNFFAYFPANASPPSILGELLSAGLGVQGMLWASSPACTELETLMLDWMVDALGLPDRFRSGGAGGGVIQDSASSATLCAVLAARDRARRGGAGLADLRAYASEHAHSSLAKAIRIAGLQDDQLRLVATDGEHALRPDELDRAIEADREAGLVPFLVLATVGTTSSTAIDPVSAVAACIGPDVWLHVDSAFAGVAAVCEELRSVNDGLDQADSYVVNVHKWLLTNFDASLLYVADAQPLIAALGILPEYLRNAATDSGEVIDYRDWQVPLGRRFRALKLWFVLRSYGLEGLRAHIRRHVGLAHELAGWITEHPDFEVVGPVPLSLVCFRHTGGDEANQAIMDRVNRSGAVYLTHTRLDDQVVLRLAIGARTTERRHVEAAWTAITDAAPRG
ncbi:MAG: pyridoxal-dependent decarboxylase [Acidimicrobiia bacterium]|nr:pyridoxal-dependent decarboxylase [Acidimicrobiia bacterium]